jgi:dephospho-CoA kinase
MIIGLTGGIGSGKSTVADLLMTLGYPVYNSDKRAKYLQNHDEEIIAKTKTLLGDAVMKNGVLDRGLVASIVFKNAELLRGLNEIVHPVVARDFNQWRDQQNSSLLFKESAILIETGLYNQCDALIVVTAPEAIRIDRVLKRDQAEVAMVKARISKQMPDAEKILHASYVIVNDDVQLIIPQVLKMIQHIKSL